MMRSDNALLNTTKRKGGYLNQFKERDMPLSPKSKVENWLVRSVAGTPSPVPHQIKPLAETNNNSNNNNNASQKRPKINETTLSTGGADHNHQKMLPIINHNNSWLSDSDEKVAAAATATKTRKKPTFYSPGQKNPDMNQKQVYNLVNELIKRKPVQIKENENIFDKSGNGKQRKKSVMNDPDRMSPSRRLSSILVTKRNNININNNNNNNNNNNADSYNVEYSELPMTLKIGEMDTQNFYMVRKVFWIFFFMEYILSRQ